MKTLKSSTYGMLLAAILVSGPANAQASLSADDQAHIQELVGKYAVALGACQAEQFADLFEPTSGAFVSGFRGRMVGRERLIKLVESERQCTNPAANAKGKAKGKGGPATPPTAKIEVDAKGVHGLVSLGTAEYQDDYVKTPQGWRFASRTVVVANEKAAGLDAPDMLAIQKLGGPNLGDNYEPDQNGVQRLMNSGVKITVANGQVSGRAYHQDGTYTDQVYERLGPGQWRVK